MIKPIVCGGLFALSIRVPCAAPVWAQEFPQRPVRIVLPYPPGSSGDVMLRLPSQ